MFAYGNSGHGTGHSQLIGSNEFYVKRITEEWDENAVTWNNQPETTDENQVLAPASQSSMQNYVIDVSKLIEDMQRNPKGLMLQLKTEQKYKRVFFATSDTADASKWPMLDVYYTTYTRP